MLTVQACVPYFEMLEKWIYKGIIQDPYAEVPYQRVCFACLHCSVCNIVVYSCCLCHLQRVKQRVTSGWDCGNTMVTVRMGSRLQFSYGMGTNVIVIPQEWGRTL